MAKIHPENHDGFTGNLGPLTVSRWKDKVVVKSRQTGPSRPKTVAQQQASRRFHRAILATVSWLFAFMRQQTKRRSFWQQPGAVITVL